MEEFSKEWQSKLSGQLISKIEVGTDRGENSLVYGTKMDKNGV